ncbi:cell division protein FtsL [Rubellimicrobium roseum]|uniref:Cell division protein FtsL n=1 Tax=Rubellimicrobium roseum TaxID=687525 RepID=A0A5C4NHY3_9RHOB|nr:cell division protein FtsL [Rubellimicrobium roseum]TNC73722.1 cell division protein FtsL [Rubellimicrobium roseum]
MKGLITIGLALLVMGLGFWAYQENYATQASLREVRDLRGQIAAAQARLDRLEAEWAYLNRPDRLRDLAEINFQRLELLPLMPEAFAAVDEVPMPSDTLAPVLSELIVSHGTPGDGEEPL